MIQSTSAAYSSLRLIRRTHIHLHQHLHHPAAFSSSAYSTAASTSSSTTTSTRPYDLLLIGGGIIGLACARAFALCSPHHRICLVESESHLAQHQSSHNSGVIHAGIYYKPGSQRAELCRIGAERMFSYCHERSIPAPKVGKLIVALNQSEIPALERLMERGLANGVQDLTYLNSQNEISQLEPNVRGVKGILSPHTGVVHFPRVAAEYAKEFVAAGGEIRTEFEVNSATRGRDGIYTVKSTRGATASATHIITCAGIYADRVASIFGAPHKPAIVPVRGQWLQLHPEYAHIVTRNIYPVPNPAFPFLGVHATPTINAEGRVNGMLLGPNAMLATSRQGYDMTRFNIRDVLDMIREPSLRAMITQHWQYGAKQFRDELFPSYALAACQQYLPSLEWKHIRSYRPLPLLMPYYERPDVLAGVRAQALGENGALEEDFVIQEQQTMEQTTSSTTSSPSSSFASFSSSSHPSTILHIRNAPSPAATSSLTIADRILERAHKSFGW